MNFQLRFFSTLLLCAVGIAQADDSAKLIAPGTVFKDCAICPEMVALPAGSFQMGGAGNTAEKPVHAVTIGAPFALAKLEITQGQWQAIMGDNPSFFAACGGTCPVEKVSWDDIQQFIRKLNAKTGKSYRLPSEAEWEYACRAGGQHEYCGSDNLDAVGWYGAYATPLGNSAHTTNRAGQKSANAWGLYDMSGNVWEWTQDCWNANYSGAPGDGTAWTTGQCSTGRVMRGGSWDRGPDIVRAAMRNGADTTHRNYNLGFRLARALR